MKYLLTLLLCCPLFGAAQQVHVGLNGPIQINTSSEEIAIGPYGAAFVELHFKQCILGIATDFSHITSRDRRWPDGDFTYINPNVYIRYKELNKYGFLYVGGSLGPYYYTDVVPKVVFDPATHTTTYLRDEKFYTSFALGFHIGQSFALGKRTNLNIGLALKNARLFELGLQDSFYFPIALGLDYRL